MGSFGHLEYVQHSRVLYQVQQRRSSSPIYQLDRKFFGSPDSHRRLWDTEQNLAHPCLLLNLRVFPQVLISVLRSRFVECLHQDVPPLLEHPLGSVKNINVKRFTAMLFFILRECANINVWLQYNTIVQLLIHAKRCKTNCKKNVWTDMQTTNNGMKQWIRDTCQRDLTIP